ncbi:hypothetical protein BD311DRAFT_753152, partial [Dichomitus squalens]
MHQNPSQNIEYVHHRPLLHHMPSVTSTNSFQWAFWVSPWAAQGYMRDRCRRRREIDRRRVERPIYEWPP